MKKKPYNHAGKQSRASGCFCVSVWMCSCVFLSAFMLVANIGGPENEISKGNKCPRTLQRPNDDMRILVIEFFFWSFAARVYYTTEPHHVGKNARVGVSRTMPGKVPRAWKGRAPGSPKNYMTLRRTHCLGNMRYARPSVLSVPFQSVHVRLSVGFTFLPPFVCPLHPVRPCLA